MGSISTPRLYRKTCGTYFIRVILHDPSLPAGKKRREARYSLRTKNPGRARVIAMWANAKLAQAGSMSERDDILDSITHGIRRWTQGDLTVDGPEDQQQFNSMLEKFPELAPMHQTA